MKKRAYLRLLTIAVAILLLATTMALAGCEFTSSG